VHLCDLVLDDIFAYTLNLMFIYSSNSNELLSATAISTGKHRIPFDLR
jgi:hypothetical protein